MGFSVCMIISWLASHVDIANVCVILHGIPAASDAVAADVAPVTAFQCMVDGEPDPDMTILVVACSVFMASWTFGQLDPRRSQPQPLAIVVSC